MGANLQQSRFNNANLVSVDLRNADLDGANFTHADLRYADLRETTNYQSANFSRARMWGAKLPDGKTSFLEPFDDADYSAPDNMETEFSSIENPFDSNKSIEEPINEHADISKLYYEFFDLVTKAQRLKDGLNEIYSRASSNSHELIGRMENAGNLTAALSDRIQEAEKANKTTTKLTNELDSIRDEVRSFIESRKNETVNNIRSSLIPELEAAKAEVKVDGILGTAYDAWAKKQRNHWIAFGVGTFVFSTSIIILLFLGIEHQTKITDFIKSMSVIETISDAGKTTSITSMFGRLAAITIPVAAIAWILRLVSRFALQNLSLANDAGQRKVSIDTYAKLVGTAGALDEKDRAIMLNAIFRPLPGASESDIAPPNLLDFVGKKG